MAGDNKKSLKTAVFEFYQLNNEKGKVYTWKHFKKGGVHKTTLYRWLEKIDKTGSVKRKPGSGTGKSNVVSKAVQRKLKKMVNNKTGVSQRKIGNSLGLDKDFSRDGQSTRIEPIRCGEGSLIGDNKSIQSYFKK